MQMQMPGGTAMHNIFFVLQGLSILHSRIMVGQEDYPFFISPPSPPSPAPCAVIISSAWDAQFLLLYNCWEGGGSGFTRVAVYLVR